MPSPNFYLMLEQMLRRMTPRHRLYRLVKAEMVRRGNWKNKPRGEAFKAGHDDRRGPHYPPAS